MFAKAFLFACTLTTVLSDDVVDRAMVLARKSVTSEFKQPVGAEELDDVGVTRLARGHQRCEAVVALLVRIHAVLKQMHAHP